MESSHSIIKGDVRMKKIVAVIVGTVVFYILIENHKKSEHILGLEYLTTHNANRDYDRERKSFKRDIEKIIKRNVKKK